MKFRILFIIIALCMIKAAYSSTMHKMENIEISICKFKYQLKNHGFENIQIGIDANKTLWIYYENRLYRNEMTALGIVCFYAKRLLGFASELVISPKSRNIPILYITMDQQTLAKFLDNEISSDEFKNYLHISYSSPNPDKKPGYLTPREKSSYYKFDFILSPGIRTQFARINDPAQLQFNFYSDVSVTLAPGLQFSGRWIVPFYNEFSQNEDKARLGHLYVNQMLRLPYNSFLSVSTGYFEYNSSGISVQMTKFFLQNHFRVTAQHNIIYQHNYQLDLNLPYQNNKTSYLFWGQYHFDRVNLITRVTWGKFHFGDKSWRIDVSRTFHHEIQLGIMAVQNDYLGVLSGITFKLPFSLSRQPSPGHVRIRTPNYYSYKYRYLPCFDGLTIDTGMEFDNLTWQLSPGYITNNLDNLKKVKQYVKFN